MAKETPFTTCHPLGTDYNLLKIRGLTHALYATKLLHIGMRIETKFMIGAMAVIGFVAIRTMRSLYKQRTSDVFVKDPIPPTKEGLKLGEKSSKEQIVIAPETIIKETDA